jgi:hypothetical protein
VEEIGHEHAHRPKARLAELLAEQPSRPVPYLADHL